MMLDRLKIPGVTREDVLFFCGLVALGGALGAIRLWAWP